MGERVLQSTAYRALFVAFLSSDHLTPATGKTIAVTISKNGAAFGNPSGGATNATEISSGWYYVDLSTTDTGTLGPLALLGTAATIDNVNVPYTVIKATNGGYTGIPDAIPGAAGGMFIAGSNAATTANITGNITGSLSGSVGSVTGAVGSVTGSVGSVTGAVGSVTGAVGSVTAAVTVGTLNSTAATIKKNTAFNNFEFAMYDTSGVLKTGLTVTATRSIDGAAFGACANAVAEVGGGVYKINLATTDLNGGFISLLFAASGAATTAIGIAPIP